MPSTVRAGSVELKAGKAVQVSDKILSALIARNGVPGMGAAVWRDGKVVWSGSAGYRNIDKKLLGDSDTIF